MRIWLKLRKLAFFGVLVGAFGGRGSGGCGRPSGRSSGRGVWFRSGFGSGGVGGVVGVVE